MNEEINTGLVPIYKSISLIVSILVGVIGLSTIFGWILDIELLKTVFPNLIAMRINSAVAFVLISISLILQRKEIGSRFNLRDLVAKALAIIVVLIGGLTFIEYAGNIDLHIDQLLYSQSGDIRSVLPSGRMAPITSLSFLLIGLALTLLNIKKFIKVTQVIAFVVGLIGLLVLIGLAFHVKTPYVPAFYLYASFHAALNLIFIFIAILFVHPEHGFADFLVNKTEGSRFARILFPLVIFVSVAIDYLNSIGQTMGLYDELEGIAFDTISTIVALSLAIYFLMRRLDKTDIKRRGLEAELRESETLFRNAMQYSAIGMGLVTLEGKWFEVNHSLCEITGYSEIEMLNLTFQEITYKDDLKKSEALANQIIRGEIKTASLEKRYVKKDGTIIWVLLQISGIRDEEGKILYYITQVENIDRRKHAEESLKETLNSLKRSNEDLERFAYVVSHDLKEPLRMIASYSGLLERKYKGKLDVDADEFIGFIIDGIYRMNALINDLLAFSRVSTQAKPFESINGNHILQNVLANLSAQIKERNADITVDKLPNITADAVQLTQVFQNLISNALKFCDEQPKIYIGFTEENNFFKFFVKDNGIGIANENFDKIFNIFEKLNPIGKYQGTGLGLAICKRIINRHGGRIWVESTLGEGSTFYFTLPK